MENTVVDLAQLKTVEFVQTMPIWSVPPQSFDILATLLIGVLAVWARELHENKDGITKLESLKWTIQGLFFGLMGGELSPMIVNLTTAAAARLAGVSAPVIDPDSYTWFFAGMVGFLGAPYAIELFSVVGDKIKNKLKDNELPVIENNIKADTMNVYENTSNNTTSHSHVLPNVTIPAINGEPKGDTQIPVPVIPVPSGELYGISRPSKHFTWEQVLFSGEGKKLGIENIPSQEHRDNICWHHENTIDPLIDAWYEQGGCKIRLNSGYRCPAINIAVKGAKNSDHMKGLADDLEPETPGFEEAWFLFCCRQMKAKKLPIRIVIGEYPDTNGKFQWTHISSDREGTADMLIRIKVEGDDRYLPLTPELSAKYSIDSI